MARLSCMIFLLEETNREDNMRKRRQARLVRSLNILRTDGNYIRIYRLTEDLISKLEEDILPFFPKEKRQGGITIRTKILYTLAFLASGSYQKTLGENVSNFISQPSASRAIRTVIDAINHPSIISKYIRFPQNINERQALKERFYEKFKIPGVIGCVDGTMVSMVRPRVHEERFYCRKGYHARNALIINDADLNIQHVDATFGGATHDSFIFNSCIIKSHLEHLNNSGEAVYLLGDSGFAQRPYMMIPFNDPQTGSQEALYNELHATARNTAERTIGLLKARFRCLLVHRVLHYDPDMVVKIIIACCILHNICQRAGLPAVELPAHLQRSEDRVLQLLQTRNQRSTDGLEAGRLARDRLVNRLWRAHNFS